MDGETEEGACLRTDYQGMRLVLAFRNTICVFREIAVSAVV